MKRKIYEQTDNYKMAVEIVKKFVDEVLDGDIDAMRTFCFDNLTKFVGNIYDPDMYLIVQAMGCVDERIGTEKKSLYKTYCVAAGAVSVGCSILWNGT